MNNPLFGQPQVEQPPDRASAPSLESEPPQYLTSPKPSILELPPFLLHVKDSQASLNRNPNKRIQWFTGDNASKTTEQIALDELAEDSGPSTHTPAPPSIGPQQVGVPPLDLSQINDVQGQIDSILNSSSARSLPESSSPKAPSLEQIIVSALLSYMNPEKSYDLLAMPFNYGTSQAKESDERSRAEFALKGEQDQERLKYLRSLIPQLYEAASQQQQGQFKSDAFNADALNKAELARFNQGAITGRAELRTPKGLLDQYMSMGLSQEQALEAAMADPNLKISQREENEAQTKTENDSREFIIQNLELTGRVLRERATNIAEQTKYLGPEVGLKVAMFWLALEDRNIQLAGMANSNALQMYKIKADAAKEAVSGYQKEAADNTREINNLKSLQTDRSRLQVYMKTQGITSPSQAFDDIERKIRSLEMMNQVIAERIKKEAVLPEFPVQSPRIGAPPFNPLEKAKEFIGSVRGSKTPLLAAIKNNSGRKYSQEKRDDPNFDDCSSFVECVYKDMGWGSPGSWTGEQIEKAKKTNRFFSDESMLEEGDLVFTVGAGQSKKHVGIFDGNGQVWAQGTNNNAKTGIPLRSFLRPGLIGFAKRPKPEGKISSYTSPEDFA